MAVLVLVVADHDTYDRGGCGECGCDDGCGDSGGDGYVVVLIQAVAAAAAVVG